MRLEIQSVTSKGLLVTILLTGCLNRTNDTPNPADRFAGRNGEIEALAEMEAGKPARLYSHVYDTVVAGYRSPGVLDCWPHETRAPIFLPLPEADFREGEDKPKNKLQAESAYRFAWAYNRQVFKARASELKRICPNARLDPEPYP